VHSRVGSYPIDEYIFKNEAHEPSEESVLHVIGLRALLAPWLILIPLS
jgi:hypothetical protein